MQHRQGVAVKAGSSDPEERGTSRGTVRVSVNQGSLGQEGSTFSGVKEEKYVQEATPSTHREGHGVQRGAIKGTEPTQREAQATEGRAQSAQVTTQVANGSFQDGGLQRATKGAQLVATQEQAAAAAGSRQEQVVVLGGQAAQGMESEHQRQQVSQLSTLQKGHAVEGAFVGQVVVDPDNHRASTVVQQSGTPLTRQPHRDAEVSNLGVSMVGETDVQASIEPGLYFTNRESQEFLPPFTLGSHIADADDETITSSGHTMMFSREQAQQPTEMYVMAGEAEQWSSVASVIRQPISAQVSSLRHQDGENFSLDDNSGRSYHEVQHGTFLQSKGHRVPIESDEMISSTQHQKQSQHLPGDQWVDPSEVHFPNGRLPSTAPPDDGRLAPMSDGRSSTVQRIVSGPVEERAASHVDDVGNQGHSEFQRRRAPRGVGDDVAGARDFNRGHRPDRDSASRHAGSPPLDATPMTRGGTRVLHGA